MASLRSIIDHAVLPPKIPGEKEKNYEDISSELLKRLIHACLTVRQMASSPFVDAFDSLVESLLACRALNQGRLDKKTVLQHLEKLQPNIVLICHVVEQNAAVLIRRESDQNNGDSVVFESFETSPVTEQVLAADNALVWDFPGRAVRLSFAEFNKDMLQKNLAAFLEQASIEAIHDIQARAKKAHTSVTEIRDTSDPALITQMLMIVLEAIGESVNVPKLRKRVRDDVNFAERASLPWRRLPFWLVLRVAAQRHLHLSLGKSGRACYKLLMCTFFSELLQDASTWPSVVNNGLEPDLIITLRTKLCRRMIKLQKEKADMSLTEKNSFDPVFYSILPNIEASILQANKSVENLWNDFKKKTKRHVHRLPVRASEDSLRLSLPNSGDYLDSLLARHNTASSSSNGSLRGFPEHLDKPIQERMAFAQKISKLAQLELNIERDDRPAPTVLQEARNRCKKLADSIHDIFSQVGDLYEGDPVQQSTKVLCIFELWMRMDESAVLCCQLLASYSPMFKPQLLDVLQLPTLSGMKRLQVVQKYLAKRHAEADHAHFLRNLGKDSFAVQYMGQSEDLLRLRDSIQRASDDDRASKERTWKQQTDQYKEYTGTINNLSCVCTWNGIDRDVSKCKRCLYWRRRKRLQVHVHEDFLPEDELKMQSIVFELGMPSYLSAYRNATWTILRDLAYPSRQASIPPHTTLNKCPQLRDFMAADSSCISLASIKKCFTETHYNFNTGLVPLGKILLPFAADFHLYDRNANIWVADLNKPLTLQHLCGVHVPLGLSGTVIKPQAHPASDFDGPSSYETQANITKCPTSLSAAEFSTYQKLLGGKSRRWLNILVELGSYNLNFSSEDTTMLLSQLATQAGPRLEEDKGVLRSVHVVMEEREFVTSLIEQLKDRLASIHSNWRETTCMELLINLSLRIFSLSSDDEMISQSLQLLNSAREATLEWISQLQTESRKTQDGAAASLMAMYSLKAALLCRRTFETHVESEASLASVDFSAWVRASVAMDENSTGRPESMSASLRSMVIRDVKMACRIENLLHTAVNEHWRILEEALGIPGPRSSYYKSHLESPWKSLQNPHWIEYIKTESYGCSLNLQIFHLNIVGGHFLVNGKPRGSLPSEMRDDPAIKYLFGSRNLFVYPSSIPGMTHRLADLVKGYSIHFGMHNSQICIRAMTRFGEQYEFIHNSVFRNPNNTSFDIPESLLENCSHWLELNTGIVEVRRQPWVRQARNWFIDVGKRYAIRNNKSKLVDPMSPEFIQISKIFESFESPGNLTVLQPPFPKGRLSVELHHLDLSFHVNNVKMLYSRELKASIDFDQDAGTWYGLASKIVLREAGDPTKRSVIIPIGEMRWTRKKFHVDVDLNTSKGYCRFEIDDIVGRLSSPPERRLLLLKAQCHAMTSFCLPDPLTGRTGIEEAIQTLRSGAAQPWAPFARSDLQTLANLLPQREYYPQHLKRMQRVTWSPVLTTSIQSDELEQVIRSIEKRANRLAKFSSSESDPVNSLGESSQLRRRAQVRRQLYERPIKDTASFGQKDRVYLSRDRLSARRGDRVYQITKLVCAPEPYFDMNSTLAKILAGWDTIEGFCEARPSTSAQPIVSQLEDPVNLRWGSLVSMCRSQQDRFSWAFQLGLLAFSPDIHTNLLMSFVAFCRIKEIRQLEPPPHATFSHFSDRGPPSIETLQELISKANIPLPKTKRGRERSDEEKAAHQEMLKKQGTAIAKLILDQWPHLPHESRLPSEEFINVALALQYIRPEWDRRHHNDELFAYVSKVDSIICQHKGTMSKEQPQGWINSDPLFTGRNLGRLIPSLSQDLVTKACPKLKSFRSELSVKEFEKKSSTCGNYRGEHELPREILELEEILTSFSQSYNHLRQNYSQDLLNSLAAFKSSYQEPRNSSTQSNPCEKTVSDAISNMQSLLSHHINSIQDAFWATNSSFKWLNMGNLLPCSTPVEILELLQSRIDNRFGPGMKNALITYGCAITEVQRLRRLRTAILREDQRAIDEEVRNTGHQNWDPLEENPDWLLLEIDSNILIRSDQVEVARAIINPASGENSLVQLNMGRGKTSCIMPMAAAVLANGNNVSRLVVPKALIMQTAQMMHSRLGGLVGREICHIPYSRQTPTRDDVLDAYCELHREIQSSRGLILTSHEYILSYRLSGLQRLADKKLDEAGKMIGFQKWLDEHCRDILDESDFTLSPKTQLNYPSGPERAVDGDPFRWQVAQGLLSMVAEFMPQLEANYRGSIEVVARSCWFPSVQFLRTDVEDELHRLIVDGVANGKAPFLHQDKVITEKTRTAIKSILTEEKFDRNLLERASNAFNHPKSAMTKLLVVRGLILHRILVLCLGKRWNVQYGLHPKRSPVAVPFAAKGVPSELSEYGHPDVAIVLTCLSFYSAGLSYEQLRQGLQRVLTSEDAALEYERWISESNLPPALESWNLINVDDVMQMQTLWRHLRKNRMVTNHYMNNFVFPLYARQFTVKLQASAWDVPLQSSKLIPGARTTGFSGTNDNRYMLPMTIQQEDLSGLLQTNAEVLSYLLKSRNREYLVLTDSNSRRLTELDMLKMLHSRGIKILIDAGAYILETENRDLAKMWFSIDNRAQSAVYFSEDNRPWVVFKDSAKHDMPLVATRLANDLTDCFVYFDEAHTRGVDLKLPNDAKAALTLALKQTKDNTMQAAMRLRHLGTTQSVVFFAPPEVDMSIKDACRKRHPFSAHWKIESPDVIYWLLEQTCRTNEDLRPLFLAQGMDFCRRSSALLQYTQPLNSASCRSKLLNLLKQSEHQTLDQLYGASSDTTSSKSIGPLQGLRLQRFADRLGGYGDIGVSHIEATGEIEQERQIESQKEAVREVQKPIQYQALKFPGLKPSILGFLQTGVLNTTDGEIIHALDYIGKTVVGKKFAVRSTGSRLFISKEFHQTIVLPKLDKNAGDRFLRPVEWILWSPSTQTALVIIPEEVELLLPKLRRAQQESKVHLIAYAAPITRAMVPFNQLRYYSMPPIPTHTTLPAWLKIEIGIVAGRLYTDYEEWKLTGDYIGGSRPGNLSPAFLLEWLGVRSRAHDVLHTPMGYVCLGRTATETHPFFVRSTSIVTPVLTPIQAEDAVKEIEYDEYEEDTSDEE